MDSIVATVADSVAFVGSFDESGSVFSVLLSVSEELVVISFELADSDVVACSNV